MKALIAAALATVFASPVLAQDAKITEAVTVLSGIQKDDAKRKAYCEMQDLLAKAEEASTKQDDEKAKTLSQQAETKSKELGDEFQKLTEIDADIDPNSEDGQKYLDAWETLEKSCGKG